MRLEVLVVVGSAAGCASIVVPQYPSDADVVIADVIEHDERPVIDLTGRWSIEHDVLPGGQWVGSYTGVLDLRDMTGRLDGVVPSWTKNSEPPVPNDSRFTGTRTGLHVEMDRRDVGSSAGFRAHFSGEVDPTGNRMEGTFQNDPSGAYGNADHGPWHAVRIAH